MALKAPPGRVVRHVPEPDPGQHPGLDPRLSAHLPGREPSLVELAHQRREVRPGARVAPGLDLEDLAGAHRARIQVRDEGEGLVRPVERRKKAFAGLEAVERRRGSDSGGGGAPVVVGADTIVAVDGEVFGKPRGGPEILAQLERLSGRSHQVLSAVTVVSGAGAVRSPAAETRLSRSRVWFRPLSEAERRRYRETGEPADKAGSYAIQGLAAAFVTRLEGSWSGVVGLPLHETVELLGRAGVPFLSPADPTGTSRR